MILYVQSITSGLPEPFTTRENDSSLAFFIYSRIWGTDGEEPHIREEFTIMKYSTKTICLAIAGVCLLFWILTFFVDALRDLVWDNLVWFFVPPILAIVFVIVGISAGKQEGQKKIAEPMDVTTKMLKLKSLFDGGFITEEEFNVAKDVYMKPGFEDAILDIQKIKELVKIDKLQKAGVLSENDAITRMRSFLF